MELQQNYLQIILLTQNLENVLSEWSNLSEKSHMH